MTPSVIEPERDEPGTVDIKSGDIKSILSELKPLLEAGDFDAVRYAGQLPGVEGCRELAERIDDYDFEGALNILTSLI